MFQVHADWMRIATRTEPRMPAALQTPSKKAPNPAPTNTTRRWLRWIRPREKTL